MRPSCDILILSKKMSSKTAITYVIRIYIYMYIFITHIIYVYIYIWIRTQSISEMVTSHQSITAELHLLTCSFYLLLNRCMDLFRFVNNLQVVISLLAGSSLTQTIFKQLQPVLSFLGERIHIVERPWYKLVFFFFDGYDTQNDGHPTNDDGTPKIAYPAMPWDVPPSTGNDPLGFFLSQSWDPYPHFYCYSGVHSGTQHIFTTW